MMWEREEALAGIIENAWDHHAPVRDLKHLTEKVDCIMEVLKAWSNQSIGSITKEIAKCRRKLADLMKDYNTNAQEKKIILPKMDELLLLEELVYLQRSRVTWLREGGQNTKYFQNRASHRKRKNTIKALRRADGTRCTVDEEMRDMAATFYEDLFT